MPELRPRRNGPAPSAPREADLDTQIQEELSAEVVALSEAVLVLLRDRGHVEATDLTEEVVLEATEMVLFAAMNCARGVVESVRRAPADGERRHSAAATDDRTR